MGGEVSWEMVKVGMTSLSGAEVRDLEGDWKQYYFRADWALSDRWVLRPLGVVSCVGVLRRRLGMI